MALTKEQKDKYLAQEGVHCPYCNSTDISGGFVEIDAGYATQTVDCLSCQKSWADVYRLADIQEDE